MKRLLKLIGYMLAAIYLCVDFIFAGVAQTNFELDCAPF